MRRLLLLLALLVAGPALAQSVSMPVGTNLQGPLDYGTAWPFVDITRYARPWGTQNLTWVDGGENPWDSGVLSQIPLDDDGYPLALPASIPGTDTLQVVFTVWANTDALPEGTYVCLYDGTGTITFDFDGTVTSSAPGRVEFDLTHGDNILMMRIEASDPDDHVRNVRVLMPGTEATHTTEPYETAWLEKVEPYAAFRFMNWGLTNENPPARWADRARPSDYTWTHRGIPFEEWIALANRLDKDVWVCVPHDADADFVRQMARLFRDDLEPERRIFVEYTNEWWNWIFPQAHFVHDSLDQSLPWPERLAPKLEEVLQIWTDEFAGQEDRLVRVFASQHYWPDLTWRVLAQMEHPDLVDAVSPAGYVGLDGDRLNAEGAGATPETILANAWDEFEDNALPLWEEYAEIADQYDLRLLYYEAGQHFTPHPFGSEQPYNQALVDVQTHPGMYDLYTALLEMLDGLGHEPAFFHFTSLGPVSGRYGSWGALDSQYLQPPYAETAPKYQALLDFIARTTTDAAADAPAASALLAPVYPNPLRDGATLSFSLGAPAHVRLTVYDLLGREVAVLVEGARPAGTHTVRWATAGLPAGAYFVRLSAGRTTTTRKAAVLR